MKNKIMTERKKINHIYHYWISVPSESGFIYHDWYSLKEMLEFPECKLDKVQQLQSRIQDMKIGISRLGGIWEAITTPKIKRGNRTTAKKVVDSGDRDEFVNTMNLWPAGSLAQTIR